MCCNRVAFLIQHNLIGQQSDISINTSATIVHYKCFILITKLKSGEKIKILSSLLYIFSVQRADSRALPFRVHSGRGQLLFTFPTDVDWRGEQWFFCLTKTLGKPSWPQQKIPSSSQTWSMFGKELREEGHAFLLSFELAGITPECLDWQPSQLINIVGKDEVSRVLVYEGL